MSKAAHNSKNLIYIMGASGVGKDSLLHYAKNELVSQSRLVFAHRYITRPVDLNGENHIALSKDEFEHRDQAGCFAMTWGAHSNQYGIGIEIDRWLTNGLTVIVNGSRDYFGQAIEKYPELKPILIVASKDTVRERLVKRARETDDQIEQRLKRVRSVDYGIKNIVHTIDNNGSLAAAGKQLCNHIRCR